MAKTVGPETVMVSQLTESTMKNLPHSSINAIQGGKPRPGSICFCFSSYRERIPPGGFMDILAALRQEEAKWEKEVSAAQQQLDNVRAAIKLLGGMGSSGKTTGGKKRVMSAAARAKISKASKERWAKFRAAKAKGKN
jgi:hypothetical protein